ncbi:hypothetical protein F5884DRAFT_882339 [Xylogone sp. PMI_703]|nr:hypothetical protein F5884DRAFT_882339 [Xylogone sp. PMI_703]
MARASSNLERCRIIGSVTLYVSAIQEALAIINKEARSSDNVAWPAGLAVGSSLPSGHLVMMHLLNHEMDEVTAGFLSSERHQKYPKGCFSYTPRFRLISWWWEMSHLLRTDYLKHEKVRDEVSDDGKLWQKRICETQADWLVLGSLQPHSR